MSDATAGFSLHRLCQGPILHDDAAQSRLAGWSSGRLALDEVGTHFGFVYEGPATVSGASGAFTLSTGMYFSLPGSGLVVGSGTGMVVTCRDYRGVFLLGGPIEACGRLRYIDGCTDSLLLPPALRGDPCLNLLHIPPGVDQTPHTHPSLRIGLVVGGAGECRTRSSVYSLMPGFLFVISPDSQHSFHTRGSSLTVIAYHPDSDFGPTDENHPMLNRTILGLAP